LRRSHVVGASSSVSKRDSPGIVPPDRISTHQLAQSALHRRVKLYAKLCPKEGGVWSGLVTQNPRHRHSPLQVQLDQTDQDRQIRVVVRLVAQIIEPFGEVPIPRHALAVLVHPPEVPVGHGGGLRVGRGLVVGRGALVAGFGGDADALVWGGVSGVTEGRHWARIWAEEAGKGMERGREREREGRGEGMVDRRDTTLDWRSVGQDGQE
jgi:hypothetical protein